MSFTLLFNSSKSSPISSFFQSICYLKLLLPLKRYLALFTISAIIYFDRYCFKRLGVSLGLKNLKNKKAPSNTVLEKAFKTCSKWNHKDITSLSKQTDCTERQIERWLRMRKMQGKSYHLNRFSENW